MSRFTLLIVTLSLLENGIQCGALRKNSKTEVSSLAKTEGGLPDHWKRFNSEFPLEKKVLGNTTNRIERSLNATSKRQAKFLPKFSILAGLDIGGGLAAKATSNLSSLAKISQATSSPGILNPYIAASYDPFPANEVHNSIQTLFRLVEQMKEKLDNFNRQINNSTHSLFSSEELSENVVDDRNRRKQKLKVKKASPKRKKQEKLEDEDEQLEDETDYVDEKPVKKTSRNKGKTSTSAKQQVLPPNMNDNSMEVNNNTFPNSTQGNNTWNRPGWYYGGNPQSIDNVSFTYGQPQQSYGPPSFNYGPPSTNYGAPSYNYGAPSQTYGSPSFSYGPPSRGYGSPYELGQYSAFSDSEPVIFDDPNDNLFISSPSQRWQQRLPFARSQKLDSSTEAPVIANSNGFVPML